MQNNDIETLNVHNNGIWGCEKVTMTMIEGQAESFHHTGSGFYNYDFYMYGELYVLSRNFNSRCRRTNEQRMVFACNTETLCLGESI